MRACQEKNEIFSGGRGGACICEREKGDQNQKFVEFERYFTVRGQKKRSWARNSLGGGEAFYFLTVFFCYRGTVNHLGGLIEGFAGARCGGGQKKQKNKYSIPLLRRLTSSLALDGWVSNLFPINFN